ncbi:MAG: Bax inhibitor-1 family protein [Gammaproteobacteria bacterium]|nr:Bax inhibitor-1 family protein [Gammaproteobacteria bacterium]
MVQQVISTVPRAESVIATNKVLRNTYLLLSTTLLFSAACAGVAMAARIPYLGPWITLLGYFGLLFLTTRLRNSAWGLAAVFALTGFMGLTLGPLLSAYMSFFSNGSELVMLAMGGTASIFLGLSGYALISRRSFSFMGSFLMVGAWTAFLIGIAALLFSVPTLSLAAAGMFMFVSSGLILLQTGDIVHGHETNYIMATVSLYVSIYNLFVSLLQLLGAFSGDD